MIQLKTKIANGIEGVLYNGKNVFGKNVIDNINDVEVIYIPTYNDLKKLEKKLPRNEYILPEDIGAWRFDCDLEKWINIQDDLKIWKQMKSIEL